MALSIFLCCLAGWFGTYDFVNYTFVAHSGVRVKAAEYYKDNDDW